MTPRRSALDLRWVVMIVLGFIAVYILAIGAYLVAEARSAAAIQEETRSIGMLFTEINRRAVSLENTTRQTSGLLRNGTAPDRPRLDGLRQDLSSGPVRAVARPFAEVPSVMRRPLARADQVLAQLENALLEVLALAELERVDSAMARMDRVDSLEGLLEQHLAAAQSAGIEDLIGRQTALDAAAQTALRVIALWVLLGVLGLPVLLALANRRIRQPLAALDAGFVRVKAGDLATQVPVKHLDEIGRVADHFNEVTRVLRDRAEQQGRLAAAGELVAGVAHEVNNPLQAIGLLAETRLEEGDVAPQVRAELQQILRQARRAGMLLRGLLKFARAGDTGPEHVNLNDTVRESLDLVSYQFGVDEIEVREELSEGLPAVYCQSTRIEQVIVNLVSNAIHAVRGKPRPRRIGVRTWLDGDAVCLAVEDNGPGVAPTAAEQIFLPFVTTKGDLGTGLGLYISRQVARDAGGDLSLDTTHRHGARFVLRLPVEAPAADDSVPAGRATPEAPPTLAALRILIIDDEESVRRPLVTFLRRRGAQCHEASDGLEALTRLERYATDVILLDLRMPRMDGVEFLQALAETRPDLVERVIVISGDLKQLEETDGVGVPPERLLAKPIDLMELEDVIRDAARAGSRPSSS